ncbi:MAG: STAS domain-containing protein [Spirochaetia bacterium]
MLRQELISESETLLVVSGPLYGEAGLEFERKIEALRESSYVTITLDLSMAVGITSSAIGKLVLVHRQLLAQNRSIRINGCSEALYGIFQKIKLDTLIQITRREQTEGSKEGFMENNSPDFLTRLEEAIALRRTWLETIRIPQLKDMVSTYRSLFQSITGTLVKKGLLLEDRYDYDGKVNTISVPPDSMLSVSRDDAEVSRRIVAYGRQIDFLADGLPFTLASMDLATLKQIFSLISYVDWETFGEASHSPTTRALARLVTKVRLSMDALSSKVLNEAQTQIEKLTRDIRERVAELEAWHRESWKAEVRAKVLPQVSPQQARTGEERTAKVLEIREAFEQVLPEGTWHPQLVQEILGEDQPTGSAERMEKLLSSLALPPPEAPGPDDVPRNRTKLLDAISSVCKVAEEIGYCEAVLVENEHDIEKRRLSVLQRFWRLFQKSLGRLDDRFYKIEYRPSPTAEAKTETIDFLKLVAEMRELKAVLSEITEAGSPGHRRIEAMDEEQLCDFLDWQLRQLRQLYRRMEGLNALLQVKAVHERRGTARSIKLELLAIENGMIRADVVRRESIARLEKKE